ncbi:Lipase [Macleaya cordata]|uniref:Lipase n=1 Tax=Macleaya cordata TaxID=56857 RepID=A0A200QU98_MACCD|nr:Lipase [Macleaya cordata]
MSIICGVPLLECVYCLGCARWAWKRCLHSAGHESQNWGLADTEEFEPVPRICRLILSVYEDDIRNPLWAPPGGYQINPDWIILRKTYEDTEGHAPPYIIYLNHEKAEIILVIRGFNLAKESDYAIFLDNKLGQKKFDGGYVHNGLLKAAEWVFDEECEVLRELVEMYPNYKLMFGGHSLGSGVATLLAMVVVQNRNKLGNLDRRRIKCYSIAPARCVSLNLAVRYADVINSVVLQARYLTVLEGFGIIMLFSHDDFLPRTATPLEDMFKSLFCLPCLLCLRCMVDTCTPEATMLKDPRRLYAPGRLYHIVNRKPFRCGRYPPVVRTAVPVAGRFEQIVLSCNATSDHAIIWIERESQRALDLMLEKDRTMEIPEEQRIDRHESLTREHKEQYNAALKQAVTLAIPDAYSPSPYGTFTKQDSEWEKPPPHRFSGKAEAEASSMGSSKKSWDRLIERLFVKDDDSDQMMLE